jgi:heteromeric Ino2p/Ino4p transcription factor
MDLHSSPPKPSAAGPEPHPSLLLAAQTPSPDPASSGQNATRESLSESAEQKLRLTDQEKKTNHIASEQKRRQAIRDGFDKLTEVVPGLEGQGRSEGLVLRRTVEHIQGALAERQRLVEEIKARGGRLPEGITE